MSGETEEDYFGWSIDRAGDVNQDGFKDIIVGAYTENNGNGRAYIFLGCQDMDNTADIILTGENQYELFGYSVAGSGDVNNDGYDDVLIGATGYDKSTGCVYLYYGGSVMNNVVDLVINGKARQDNFGITIAGVGDVNADGYADVLVSTYNRDYYPGIAGSFLYYGGQNSLSKADIDLPEQKLWSQTVISLAGVGNVNADNYYDFIIGTPENDEYNNGAAYLYFGSQTLAVEEPTTNPLSLPEQALLQNNYPNPFNPATTITFDLPERAVVDIVIYDISGRTVRTLLHEWRSSGQHRLAWDGRNDSGATVGSGVYLCKFSTDKGYSATKRMTLVK